MKRRFFARNLILFLIPMLVPLLVLGGFSIFITQMHIRENVEKNSFNQLVQAKDSIELMLSEIDSLSLNFDKDPVVVKRLKGLLTNGTLSMQEIEALDFIKNYVDVPVNSKPYLHSVYVYFDMAGRRFFSSTEVLSDLDACVDAEWYDSYQRNRAEATLWTEPREIRIYAFDRVPTPVLSVYKTLSTTGAQSSTGVLVMNIRRANVDHLLENIAAEDRQRILVLDGEDRVLFSNQAASGVIPPEALHLPQTQDGALSNLKIDGVPHVFSSVHSERYGWRYVALIPRDALYRVPHMLGAITWGLVALTLAIGLALSWAFTRRNYRQVHQVLEVLESAENGGPLPEMPSRVHDEYGYIIRNILRTFLEQSYLKIQLSEKHYRLRTLEMEALQAQINPHFLFNTLHAIYWESAQLTNGPNRATGMLSLLTDIMEYALAAPTAEVMLDEEIRYTKSYLEILNMRYRDRFAVIWDYESDILEMRCMKLLLQPIVENAVYHGLRALERRGSMKVRIWTSAVSDVDGEIKRFLHVHVVDDGVGMTLDVLQKLRGRLEVAGEAAVDAEVEPVQSGRHIGLVNTIARIRMRHGDEVQVRILSRQGRGTAVCVRIPVT